jgi:hypothetical protein
MKKSTLIFLAFLVAACGNSTHEPLEDTPAEGLAADSVVVQATIVEAEANQSEDPPKISYRYAVDSVVVAKAAQEDICFLIDRSTYPKISGLADQQFQARLNTMLRRNFNAHVSLAKKEFGGCPEEEEEEEYADIFPSASGDFSILTMNDSMLSIVQYMFTTVGYGGNSWTPSSFALTADVENNIVYGNKEFRMDRTQAGYLNSKIKVFFDQLFPYDAEQDRINYPLIKTRSDFDKLDFALRNDSVMLIIESYPTGHFSYSTYIIPIDKYERRRK